MSDDVTRTASQECPHCGYEIDAHGPTQREKRPPVEGDFSVCIACAGILRYTKGLRLVPSSIDDPDADLQTRAELQKIVSGIAILRRTEAEWPEKFKRRGHR